MMLDDDEECDANDVIIYNLHPLQVNRPRLHEDQATEKLNPWSSLIAMVDDMRSCVITVSTPKTTIEIERRRLKKNI